MNFETWLRSDLTKPLEAQTLHGLFFSADNAANLIGVEVFNDGLPATLSGTCIGYAVRADGGTLTITGTVSGNKASIVLPASAYVIEGPLSIVIKIVSGSVKTTVGACYGYVQRATTDTIIDPGHVIPSVEELLAMIEPMEQGTAAANAAAASANTAATNANNKASAANTAATNANNKATAANNAATAANKAAANANEKAALADQKATLADTAAANADEKAAAADTAATAANEAAANANEKATLADQKATAANTAATNANTAATNANNAASTANTAATNANTARDNANAAAAAANAAAAAAPTQASSEIKYQVSANGTSIPTGQWQDAIPNVPQGSWLWVRTIITWDNGEVSDPIYSKARSGIDGSGSVVSVNSLSPDANGNVDLGDIVHTVNGTAPDSAGNVALGSLVKQVNSVSPDSSGNVALPIDAAPTDGSSNPVSSDGVYDAMAEKVSKSGDAMTGSLSTTGYYNVRFMDADIENPPATSNNKDVFDVLDKNGNTIAMFRAVNTADGRMGIHMGTRREINGSPAFNTIQLLTGADGTAYVALSNPDEWREALQAVNKAGDIMTGDLVLTKSSNYPSMLFKRYTNPDNGPQQMIQTNETGTYSYMAFYQRINADSAWEGFRLPSTTEALTSGNVNYSILTTKPGGSLYYAPGETYSTTSEMMMCGHITNGVRNVHVGLWLPKSLEKISNISITTLSGSIRGVKGYVGWTTTTNFLTQSGLTITATRTTPNGVRINIASSSDLSNATANTPVALSASITLSFS